MVAMKVAMDPELPSRSNSFSQAREVNTDDHEKCDLSQWRTALSMHHDNLLTSVDVMDAAFYLGKSISPEDISIILKELIEKVRASERAVRSESTIIILWSLSAR